MSLVHQSPAPSACSCSSSSLATAHCLVAPRCRPVFRSHDNTMGFTAWRSNAHSSQQHVASVWQRSGSRRPGVHPSMLSARSCPSPHETACNQLQTCGEGLLKGSRGRWGMAIARRGCVTVAHVGPAAADMGSPAGGSDAAASTPLPTNSAPQPNQDPSRQPEAHATNGHSTTGSQQSAPSPSPPQGLHAPGSEAPTASAAPAGVGTGATAATSAATSAASTDDADTGAKAPAAGSTAPAPATASLDGLPDTQKYVLADEWGFTHVGADLPEGTSPTTFTDMFPEHFFAFDAARATLAVVVPLAAMAAGYGWLWYMHSICPLWQQLLCGLLIGTAYTGLFKVAHECARYCFLPQAPALQEALGTVLMLPSLYAFPSWRLAYVHHLLHVNMLWQDVHAWHPYTKVELASDILAGRSWRVALQRLVLRTPLKFLASIGHWVRSFDGFDLQRFHPGSYWGVLAGWAAPVLFVGLGFPAMVAAGGFSGFLSCYVLPWLVFHFWLSTLSLLQHTAPHIPFRTPEDGYDAGRATLSGTVTVRLPRPLELLLNEANYTLPQMIAPGLPFYHARAAYDYMRERLLPYLTEASLTLKLLTNHVTKWQVYDEEAHTYLPMDEVERGVEADMAAIAEEVRAELQAEGAGSGAGGGEGRAGGEGGLQGNGAGLAVA